MIHILDKDLIKQQIDNTKLIELLQELGSAEPFIRQEALVFETICHNCAGEGSHKLYYYPNTNLFKCYTSCGDSFDIFDLVIRQFRLKGQTLSVYQAIKWVYDRMDQSSVQFHKQETDNDDWNIFNRYREIKEQQIVDRPILKEYSRDILKSLPFFIVDDWRNEGITPQTMKRFGIKYNPVSNAVIIPHYDENKRLVGIRQRTMIKEDEELYGKYRPALINGEMYNHPLSYCLYGLSLNQENIKKVKKAVIFEGEKSVMLFDSIFGQDNNIAVACCGSNISSTHIQLLIDMGVQEVIIAFDKEFKKISDEGFSNQVRNLKNLHKKYSSKLLISFMFDKEGLLGYKDSPIDKGKESFINLYKKRFTLEDGGSK